MFCWEVTCRGRKRKQAVSCFCFCFFPKWLNTKWQDIVGRCCWWGNQVFSKCNRLWHGFMDQAHFPSPCDWHLTLPFTIYIFPVWLFSEQRTLQPWLDVAVTFWLVLCCWADAEVTDRKAGARKSQDSWGGCLPLRPRSCLQGMEEMQQGKEKWGRLPSQPINNGCITATLKNILFFILSPSQILQRSVWT